jgi:hypothetical protein
MPKPDLVILVDIPALDRLVAYLESADQGKIDAAAELTSTLTARLAASSQKLKTSIGENNAS